MPPACCNVLRPSQVGLARFVVERLGRASWLEVPWVHATTSLDLSREIPEDAADFPEEVMRDARIVSLALRIAAVNHVKELWLQTRAYAFFPSKSPAELEGILRAKGFDVLAVPEAELAKEGLDVDPTDAKERLLTDLLAPPAPPLGTTLLLELVEVRPSAFEDFVRIAPDRLGLLPAGDPRTERALLAGFEVIGEEHRSGFVGACAKYGHVRVAELLAPRVTLKDAHAHEISAPTARLLYPTSGVETRRKWLTRNDALLDLGVADPDPSLRALVAWRVSEPEAIASLTRDPDVAVRAALARNGRLDGAALDRLAASGREAAVMLKIATHPRASAAAIAAAAAHEDADVRAAAAAHPALHAGDEARLAREAAEPVRLAVAARPTLDADLREMLRRDSSARVAAAATAGSPLASASDLAAISETVLDAVRPGVAAACRSPEVLAAFARGGRPLVLYAVAKNAHAPQALLEELGGAPELFLRCAVAANPSASAELLGRLATDIDVGVRRFAATTLGKLQKDLPTGPDAPVSELIEEILADPRAATRRELARQKGLSPKVLEALADDDDEKVRGAVGRSASTPLELLAWLARDRSPEVRAQVLASSRCPRAVAELLLEDDVVSVREAAAVRLAKMKTPKKPGGARR